MDQVVTVTGYTTDATVYSSCSSTTMCMPPSPWCPSRAGFGWHVWGWSAAACNDGGERGRIVALQAVRVNFSGCII